jgi:hypothetical protein
MASAIFDKFYTDLGAGNINWSSSADTIKCALVTSGYTVDRTNLIWGTSSGPGMYETSGSGYTAGGVTLTGRTVTQDDTNFRAIMDSSDFIWTGATFSAYGGVVYDATNSNSLMCYLDFGASQSVSAGTFTVQIDSSGLIKISTT